MTTIAWDGRRLAGDKQVTYGSFPRTTTKVFKVWVQDRKGNGGGYVLTAGSGDGSTLCEMLEWVRNGRDPAAHPVSMRTGDGCCIVVDQTGTYIYERGPHARRIEQNEHFAMGSGRDFALMAMHLGKTAVEAVELTSEFDVYTGRGVSYVELL